MRVSGGMTATDESTNRAFAEAHNREDKTMNLYRDESSYPKVNAQRNLDGRTHYVDENTLRFHKSRVLSTHVTDGGLLFAIVVSDAAGPEQSHGRIFRYVIFDVFGTVLDRKNLEDGYKSRDQAIKAMWIALNAIDAKAHTLEAIERARLQYLAELHQLALKVDAIETAAS